jgi:hypothetical protein
VLKTKRNALRDKNSPHSKNICGAEDQEERFEGQKIAHTRIIYAALKTKRNASRDKNSPHSKNVCGAED